MADRLGADEIGALSLFSGLAADEHARLAGMATVEVHDAGQTVFTEGDPPGDLYVVLDGRVTLGLRIPGRTDTSFLSLQAGELLGWSALLARPRVATARVVQTARLLRLPRSELLELCETDHHVGYAIMRQAFEEISDRLQHTRLQLLDMFGKPGS